MQTATLAAKQQHRAATKKVSGEFSAPLKYSLHFFLVLAQQLF